VDVFADVYFCSLKRNAVMVRNFSRFVIHLCLLVPLFTLTANADSAKTKRGLNAAAKSELSDAGVDKYLGTSKSIESDFGVWTQHSFSQESGDGPKCIAGTDYSVFTKAGDPKKLLIFLQGGGACWQNFYQCNLFAAGPAGQAPPEQPPFPGVFDTSSPDNPFADHSVVYMPYCDGSAFGGDKDVVDPLWQAYIENRLGLDPGTGPSTRYHRGVRNQSAGMDVAGELFPRAKQITVMGHSAGGVGVAAFAPFLARFVFGNNAKLTVFNDAGPIVVNLGNPPAPHCADIACFSVLARASDWDFAKFYPQSCIADGRCNAFGQQTGIIDWRLDNDGTIREAFYETDSDATNRFFAQGDGTLMPPDVYRELIVTEHGALQNAHPKRYKRFIVSGDDTHGAVQGAARSPCSPNPQPFLFYTQDANGTLLSKWTTEFVRIGNRQSKFGWKDIVEDYVGPTICSG
jgi:hypothetical protein